MTGSTVRPAGPARWLLAVAVLVGLFVMHGSPGSVTGGCAAGGMSVAASPAPPADHAAGTVAAGRAALGAPTGSMGTLCVSAPVRHLPRGFPPVLVLLAVSGLLAELWRCRVAGIAGPRRRGPPGGARRLVVWMCVSRT